MLVSTFGTYDCVQLLLLARNEPEPEVFRTSGLGTLSSEGDGSNLPAADADSRVESELRRRAENWADRSNTAFAMGLMDGVLCADKEPDFRTGVQPEYKAENIYNYRNFISSNNLHVNVQLELASTNVNVL